MERARSAPHERVKLVGAAVTAISLLIGFVYYAGGLDRWDASTQQPTLAREEEVLPSGYDFDVPMWVLLAIPGLTGMSAWFLADARTPRRSPLTKDQLIP